MGAARGVVLRPGMLVFCRGRSSLRLQPVCEMWVALRGGSAGGQLPLLGPLRSVRGVPGCGGLALRPSLKVHLAPTLLAGLLEQLTCMPQCTGLLPPGGGGGVVGPRLGVLQVSLGAFARAVARFLHTVHDHLRAYAFDSYLLIPLIFHCVLALSLSPRSFISRRRSLEEECGLFRSVFSDHPTSSVLG